MDSLLASGTPAGALLVIDNGSSDATPQWLASRGRRCHRFATASTWAAAARGRKVRCSRTAEWVVLLNNDVIVCAHGLIQAQIDAARPPCAWTWSARHSSRGRLDYDFDKFTPEFLAKMSGHACASGWFHGVCFSVRRAVFQKIGFLDTDRLLYGREDAEFLARCKRHGVPVGTVGDALLHHFGMITQTAMKQELGVSKFGDHRYFYSKIGLGWWGRQNAKFARKGQARRWSEAERERTGYSLHMVHRNGQVEFR